jgi:hypothetical protein
MAIVTPPPAEGNGKALLLSPGLPEKQGETKSRSRLDVSIVSHIYLSVKP